MHSLIIHMSSSIERRENVDRLLSDLPNAQVIEAVDGRLPEVQTSVDLRPGDLHDPHYPFAIKGGEIGCFLSHRACWQKIVDENWDAAIVAEDDLAIAPDRLAPLMKLLARNSTPDCFIRIPPKDRETQATVTDREEDMALFTPYIIGLQTTAQVVGRNAAQRLLAATQTLDRPVDTFLQMHWITDQKVETILPNGATEMPFGAGSTVQHKSGGLRSKLMREIRRARYRALVNRNPQT
ncbi:Glycosyltransferase involved in LPS biosynthesis, GR25 family [Shimia gijangensis]|uniref:Glycosyltransferase involved in LPS biosynthesis, GR25 family n=1 Tax=Shimia gijangensis TaxID=1470563 RepID=A0A1M6B5D2_9RHOB|nr:glycosyltransferase family 25 protein [Shimia gijangensis]SHI43926.1 Glycosyltransferase involved in LPS biosynthesis, GR25 family [Shimia gijangensis]